MVSLVLSVCSFDLLVPQGFFRLRVSFLFPVDRVGVGVVVFVGSDGNSCFVSVKVGCVLVGFLVVLSLFAFAFCSLVSVSL